MDRQHLWKDLIYDNAACQEGKGTHFALNRMDKFLKAHYKQYGNQGYILKCDIKSYFASVNHIVLKEQLEKIIKDKKVFALLVHFIDKHETTPGAKAGIPLGNQSSQWYGIYYLSAMDHMIKEKMKIKHYIRYMDDFVLIHHDKEYLQKCLTEIKSYVEEELKITLNEKTQIYPLKQGYEFLGWKYHLSNTGKIIKTVKKQSKIRAHRRFKKLNRQYKNGEKNFKDVKNVVMSYHGHFKHGKTYHLRKRLYNEFK